jgi:hypothetical protein
MATNYWNPNDPNNPGRGGGGGAGIVLLLFLGIAIAVAAIAGLIALVATPILIAMARWRGSKLTYGESIGPMFKAVFVLVAINAALFYLLQSWPGLLGSSGLGLDLARGENALSLLAFGTDISPQFAMVSATQPPLGLMALLAALAAVQFLPFTAMAAMLRRELYYMRGGLGFALAASVVSVLGGLVLTVLMLRLLASLGTPIPLDLVRYGFYAGIFALATALLGGFALALLAAFTVRDDSFGATFRIGFVAVLCWAGPMALLFYYIRAADPMIAALIGANPGDGDPLAALIDYVVMQLPGLALGSWVAELWAMPRRTALVRVAAIAVVANIAGILVLGRLLG